MSNTSNQSLVSSESTAAVSSLPTTQDSIAHNAQNEESRRKGSSQIEVLEVLPDGNAIVATDGLFRVLLQPGNKIAKELRAEHEAEACVSAYNSINGDGSAHAVRYSDLSTPVDLKPAMSHEEWSYEYFDKPLCPGDIPKQAEAKRLSKLMDVVKIKQDPKGKLEGDEASLGNLYDLQAQQSGEFPDFGFEVTIDGRHNDGDLAQSVVDELFAISKMYGDLAKSTAKKLNRRPSKAAVRRIARIYLD